MANVNLHVFLSDFKHESRVLRETKSIVDSGLIDKIFIAGLWERGVKELEGIDNKRAVWRIPLKTRNLPKDLFSQIIKYIEWAGKIFFRFRKEHITHINCHGLSSLPIGALFKLFKKSKLIYDPHELETEANGLSGIRKKFSKLLERLLISYSDSIIVVSNSIAEWYKSKYSMKKVHVVKNVPYNYNYEIQSICSNVLKEKFGIKGDEILFIYQGGLSKGRGIQIILDAFARVNAKRHVVFMGRGPLEEVIMEYEKNFSNIHLHVAVKPEEVLRYTSSADIGVSLIENTCLSYYYSLPNKVFEYLLSGLPMIVSDFPEMGKFVDENNCGWKVTVDSEALLKLIERLSYEDIFEKKNKVLKCKDNYGWHKEEETLLKIYKSMRRL
jgi:glycosyltransferase involved in cell wall biosynthesis